MSEHVERYLVVSEGFASRLGACPQRWDAPTPCSDWTARDLVLHSAEVHRNVAGMVLGAPPDPPPGDDPAEAWRAAAAALAALLDDPAARDRTVTTRAGEMPFAQLVGTMLTADTLIHTWDLARAVGADERLDPAAVSAVLAFMQPNDAVLRVPGGFGEKIEPPPGADEQVRLLCFAGRSA